MGLYGSLPETAQRRAASMDDLQPGTRLGDWVADELHRAGRLPATACLVVLARKRLRVAFSLFKHPTDFDPTLIPIA